MEQLWVQGFIGQDRLRFKACKSNKKDLVTNYLKLNNVDLCCLQETEVPSNFPEDVHNTGGYNLELELNDSKKRAGIYRQSPIFSSVTKKLF